ncbi:hypothetical protein [Streptomyces sp. NPDC014733]|uniref:hypothetical protein n=1 Tax=Streptomyces sp. NPDC014733 TaxID=3364885 RepID=UPI0037030C56
MNITEEIQNIASQIGIDPDDVAHALETAHSAYDHLNGTQTDPAEFHDRFANNRKTAVSVAIIAMRSANRRDDAQILLDTHKASTSAVPYQLPIHTGIGAVPQDHNAPHVQDVIRILAAAGLPPIHTDGTNELRPGFQVLACDELPGWVFIAPDPDAENRTGFAGGELGYLAVMRWVGWNVYTERLTGGLYAVGHPDHSDTTHLNNLTRQPSTTSMTLPVDEITLANWATLLGLTTAQTTNVLNHIEQILRTSYDMRPPSLRDATFEQLTADMTLDEAAAMFLTVGLRQAGHHRAAHSVESRLFTPASAPPAN